MKDMFEKIDELHRRGKFHGFSIWPTTGGQYQVNLATTAPNNWRVRRAATPSEGTALVLAMDFMDDGVAPEPQRPFSDEILKPRNFEDAALAELDAGEHAEAVAENAEAEAGIFD
jgi:hypothetical protein